MNDPIQIIREATEAMADKIHRNPRLYEKQTTSLVQSINDQMALIKRIDELEELRALRD